MTYCFVKTNVVVPLRLLNQVMLSQLSTVSLPRASMLVLKLHARMMLPLSFNFLPVARR